MRPSYGALRLWSAVLFGVGAMGMVLLVTGTMVAMVLDDGPVKPTRIWSRVGRRPILATGNSDGDIEMLRFAEHPLRPSLSLLVYHDDAEREFAYDAGAQRSIAIARERRWTLVSMRDDWKTMYGAEH